MLPGCGYGDRTSDQRHGDDGVLRALVAPERSRQQVL
jgi:hypothetical protein